jgi:hypothetical protein
LTDDVVTIAVVRLLMVSETLLSDFITALAVELVTVMFEND